MAELDTKPLISDEVKSILYPSLFASFIFLIPFVIGTYLDYANPVKEPEQFMGDRVVKVERVAMNNEYIFTSRDGKIASTRDFRRWQWLQR